MIDLGCGLGQGVAPELVLVLVVVIASACFFLGFRIGRGAR